MKKLGLATVVLSALLLSGCGGGGGDSKKEKTITEQISERDGVIIVHGSNTAFCELMKVYFEREAKSEVKDTITDVPVNTVNCSTYGKNNDDGETCENVALAEEFELTGSDKDMEIYQDNSTACVIGINKVK